MKLEGETAPTVLVIDDDPVLLRELSDALADHAIIPHACGDWALALAAVADQPPDLIILDQRLGSIDTLLKLPDLRRVTTAPVLFLTGNRSEADRVIGLELGADDFLLKPISGRELVARVRAHLRRLRPDPRPVTTAGSGGWRIDAGKRRVCRPDGSAVSLTAAEFDLLARLAITPGAPVDRETLTNEVLRRAPGQQDRSIDNLVHQLRRKIGRSSTGEAVTSIRNLGYVFTGFPDH